VDAAYIKAAATAGVNAPSTSGKKKENTNNSWNACEVKNGQTSFRNIPSLKHGFYSVSDCLMIGQGEWRKAPQHQGLGNFILNLWHTLSLTKYSMSCS